MVKLNLGCGKDYMSGYINCDIRDDIKKDKYIDLNKKLPFKDNSVDEIFINSVLMYLEDVPALFKELIRISKHNAILNITEPHFTNPFIYSDINIKTFFGYWSFWTFSSLGEKEDSKYFYQINKIKTKLIFPKGKLFFNYLTEPIMNVFPSLYEYIFSCFIRCWNVNYIIRVTKNKSKSQ